MSRDTDRTDSAAIIRDLERRIRRLEAASPLASSSVTRGRVRIASAEGLIVEGSARIVGTMNGDGTLDWDGTVQFDGPVTINGNVTRVGAESATGPTTLSGLLTVNGDAIFNTSSKVTINGPADIKGATTVQGDLDVTGGGTIQAGAVTISPANGGQISIGTFTLASDGSMTDTDAAGVRVNDALKVLNSLFAYADVVLPALPVVTDVQPNLYISPTSGAVMRIG